MEKVYIATGTDIPPGINERFVWQRVGRMCLLRGITAKQLGAIQHNDGSISLARGFEGKIIDLKPWPNTVEAPDVQGASHSWNMRR